MPIRSPGYNIPAFQPTGNAEVDAALSQWHTQFGQQYTETQQAIERIPAIYTTFVTSSGRPNPDQSIVSLRVPLQGGEQVVVVGYFDLQVTAGGVLTTDTTNYAEVAEGKLQITYPAGTTQGFGGHERARLRVAVAGKGTSEGTVQRTSVTERANVAFTWPIEARFQDGGEHTFDLGTSGGGIWHSAQLTVQVF